MCTCWKKAFDKIIFEQTGIGKPLVDELKNTTNFIEDLLKFQQNYYKPQNIITTAMTPLTNWNIALNNNNQMTMPFEIATYKNGYIFLSKSTATFNWQHGHAGIVVDALHGKILESMQPNTLTSLQNIDRWQYYPTFKMLRPKDLSQLQLDEIAQSAAQNLKNIPYNIFAQKSTLTTPPSTQCALLVWQAYAQFGIDIDNNGGLFVVPSDIAKSDALETLQIFGFDHRSAW